MRLHFLSHAVVFFFLYVFLAAPVLGQKSIINQDLIWYGYFLNVRFSPKWFWVSEVQERHYINPVAQHQLLFRTHLHRELPAGWEASGGICLFLQSPHDPKSTAKLIVPELRPHVELAYRQRLKHIALDYRYRLEARFFHQTNEARTELEDGFNFSNWRFRWRIQAAVPLYKIDNQRKIRFRLSNEVHLNLGSKIVVNVFDQNRIYGGLSIDVLPNFTFDMGYMNWFQQRPDGKFFNRDILRFTTFHRLDLQKKAKTSP